jgi:hypothetical protein
VATESYTQRTGLALQDLNETLHDLR